MPFGYYRQIGINHEQVNAYPDLKYYDLKLTLSCIEFISKERSETPILLLKAMEEANEDIEDGDDLILIPYIIKFFVLNQIRPGVDDVYMVKYLAAATIPELAEGNPVAVNTRYQYRVDGTLRDIVPEVVRSVWIGTGTRL